MEEIVKILIVIAVSSVKFVGGPPLAYAYRFNFFEIILYSVIGGMVGVVIISYFSPWVVVGWEKFKNLFRPHHEKIYAKPTIDIKGNVRIHYSYVSKDKSRKLFTPGNRRIVKLWRTYGLIGIAAITPVILSIPIGTFFAMRLANNRERVFLYMFIAILFWSILITSILYKLIPVPAEIITE